MEKEMIKIMLDFLHGPVWSNYIKSQTFEKVTGVDIVDNDIIIKELNFAIGDIYNGYYEFDTHDMPCWFNHEQEFKDRFIMRDLLQKLVDRLDELNDGSYIVEPIALEYYKKLCKQDKAEDKN